MSPKSERLGRATKRVIEAARQAVEEASREGSRAPYIEDIRDALIDFDIVDCSIDQQETKS